MASRAGSGAGKKEGGGFRGLFRARAAVTLVGIVAVLSVGTGIVNIGSTSVSGPLAPYVPDLLRQTVGFTGALTGFLMLASAAGLRRRLRAAWYSTLVLLPVTALQGLLQSSIASLPLVALSAVSLVTLLFNRRVFERELDLTATQVAALAAIIGAQVYGTVGTYVLREEFTNVDSLTDAFYYTLVTASTVGYGDVTPVPGSDRATLFAMSVLIVGTASFAVALGTLLTPAIEARLANALGNMSDSQLDLLDDHVIVLGVGDLTAPIVEEIARTGQQFVVIVENPERAQWLRDRGYEVLTADPTEDEPLQRAGIERARALVAATEDDAQDALSILAARELNPGLRIVASATERENIKKLKRAGANEVISPASIGGELVVKSALGQEGMETVADRIIAASEGGAESEPGTEVGSGPADEPGPEETETDGDRSSGRE
jgi:voltage-gated potassium channel